MPRWRSDSAIKLITYSEELVDGKPFYAFSNSLPVKALNREPAGHAFHSAALKLLGCDAEESSEGSDKKTGDDDDDEEDEYEYVPSFNSRRKKKGKKKPYGTHQQQQQQDHYALLGLSNLRCQATEDQIKKSYREAALKHHPDKHATLILAEETEEAKAAKKDEIESRFRAIQEAYEVLMDPTKRRIFDSTYEFDDEVSPQDFFKVFGPAFKRIAKWSVDHQQRVPELGDENTNFKDVVKFYNYWFGFKSCREVPNDGEWHDVEKGDSRQERRWMERENAKKAAKFKKEEDLRIRSLVENAYRTDPRFAKRKEEEEAEKQKKKEAAKKKREEEAAVAAEEEKRRREEAAESAQRERKAKEKENKLLQRERNRLRTLSAPVLAQHLLDISQEDVKNLCMSLNMEQLQSLCDEMGNKQGVELAEVIKDACNISSRNQEANSKEKESEKNNGAEPNTNGASRNQETNSKEKESEKANGAKPTTNGASMLDNTQKKKQQWSKEEIDMLRKGIIKYPKGISRRWEVISDYIGTGRSVEEILKATKTVLLQKPDSAKAFDVFLEKRKPSVSIASPLSTREEFGESIPMAKPPSKETVVGQSSDNGGGEASGSSDIDGWSVVLERALVKALKTFPKETSQRWERVAAAVPGKTVIQCKKKFAELKEFIRSKKAGV